MFLALIYDYFNVLCKVIKRDTIGKATRAADYYTPKQGGYWNQIIETTDETEIEMYENLINQ